MTDRKPWVISILPVKCPDDMTGIPNYYIQIWEKYVGKVKPEGGDREDWIETCSRLYWGVRNLGEDAIVRVHGKTDLDSKRLIGLPHFGQVVNYRDDERRGLDVGVTPATLVRKVVAGTPSIMGG